MEKEREVSTVTANKSNQKVPSEEASNTMCEKFIHLAEKLCTLLNNTSNTLENRLFIYLSTLKTGIESKGERKEEQMYQIIIHCLYLRRWKRTIYL